MNDFRSVLLWLGRALANALANALAGGLAFAVVGAFCGGGAALVIALLESGFSFSSVPIGAVVGAVCGVAGFFTHLLPALRAEPDDFWEPFFDLTARVSWGQGWGTIAACTAFITVEFIRSLLNNTKFSAALGEDMLFFAIGAPVTMICGAIAAAVFKRD